eukprot:CAMPEP_0201529448 /NCGR_PEP_ID=MMETSP0161_2-20130828/41774_1 /ASSEMBLY_ACC=CAM_ASM_000251 /TAXON_ID=180227 /ORGANISM="Neoparamoeba aestuarina, Strain SoJaBio B1-5/56/2" /LENGTH=174 /DNA_ID=CAMNT_0047931253 /DNA_START=12 /DNA_END=533 /DNA_ORIENTATION=+
MAANDKLIAVGSSLQVEDQMPLQLTSKQTIVARGLLVVKKILEQHDLLWSKRSGAETSRRLRKAKNFVTGMLLAILEIDNAEEFDLNLRISLYEQNATMIVCSIRSFKGASEGDKDLVVEHRNQVKHEIVGVLEFLNAYYMVKFAGAGKTKTLSSLITDFQAVKIKDDVEDLDE